MIKLIPMLGIAAGCLWSYQSMANHRDQAERAAEQLAECERLAEQIELLRQGPARVSVTTQSATALAQMVEEAAGTANLPRDRIVNIDPGAPRRIGDTEYQEQATTVELRSVSLAQIVAFVDALELAVSTLVIRLPHQAASSEQEMPEVWNAEVTLTDRIYAPKEASVPR